VTRPADWVVDGPQGLGQSVLSILPSGFETHVRVFHPARTREGRVERRTGRRAEQALSVVV
jgi:hypothetical protein